MISMSISHPHFHEDKGLTFPSVAIKWYLTVECLLCFYFASTKWQWSVCSHHGLTWGPSEAPVWPGWCSHHGLQPPRPDVRPQWGPSLAWMVQTSTGSSETGSSQVVTMLHMVESRSVSWAFLPTNITSAQPPRPCDHNCTIFVMTLCSTYPTKVCHPGYILLCSCKQGTRVPRQHVWSCFIQEFLCTPGFQLADFWVFCLKQILNCHTEIPSVISTETY